MREEDLALGAEGNGIDNVSYSHHLDHHRDRTSNNSLVHAHHNSFARVSSASYANAPITAHSGTMVHSSAHRADITSFAGIDADDEDSIPLPRYLVFFFFSLHLNFFFTCVFFIYIFKIPISRKKKFKKNVFLLT